MRGLFVLLLFAVVSPAQDAAVVPSGVPLRIALEQRVIIKKIGEPIRGRLIEPVYVYDRMVLAAGTLVEGHIAGIGGVPAMRRISAILSGNFTPPRDVRARFDTLVLNDGSRRPLETALSRGTAHTVRIRAGNGKQKPALDDALAARAFTAPGKMSRLKTALLERFPYHRQSWRAGTLFDADLQAPLSGLPSVPADPQSGGEQIEARLVASVNSAIAQKGAPLEAVVTRPLFNTDHSLLIPEGSRLLGEVVESRRARFLHRNGKLLFTFHQLKLTGQPVQAVQGFLEGVDADFDAHLALDSEGTAHTSDPKSRFIFPALAVAAAGLSFHQDYNARGVPDADSGGRAESGAVGLGLIGVGVAQASRALASTIAITGAAFSLYTTFLARGEDVVLPANTAVRVGLKPRRQPVK